MENSDKVNTKHDNYFTFPIKFLWAPPKELQSRLQTIASWCAWAYIKWKFDAEKVDHNLAVEACRRKFRFGGGGFDYFREGYDTLQTEVPTATGDIFTSVSSEYLREAMKGKMDPGLFLFVAAVKSTIGVGKRNFVRTNRKAISYRMYGNPDRLTRYSIDKLFETATRKQMASMIPAGRGYYVSIRHKPKALLAAIETRVKDFQSKKGERSEAAKKIAALRRNFKQNAE